MTPDTATNAYESTNQQMPLQIAVDDENRIRRQSSAQSKGDDFITVSKFDFKILKSCQIMVD
jgi:hypothetical protein